VASPTRLGSSVTGRIYRNAGCFRCEADHNVTGISAAQRSELRMLSRARSAG
jgi:hypothetical protein